MKLTLHSDWNEFQGDSEPTPPPSSPKPASKEAGGKRQNDRPAAKRRKLHAKLEDKRIEAVADVAEKATPIPGVTGISDERPKNESKKRRRPDRTHSSPADKKKTRQKPPLPESLGIYAVYDSSGNEQISPDNNSMNVGEGQGKNVREQPRPSPTPSGAASRPHKPPLPKTLGIYAIYDSSGNEEIPPSLAAVEDGSGHDKMHRGRPGSKLFEQATGNALGPASILIKDEAPAVDKHRDLQHGSTPPASGKTVKRGRGGPKGDLRIQTIQAVSSEPSSSAADTIFDWPGESIHPQAPVKVERRGKEKRRVSPPSTSSAASQSNDLSRKKRRIDFDSSTTSDESMSKNESERDSTSPAAPVEFKDAGLVRELHWTKNQPTLKDWAKNLSENPNLSHPIHNPISPRKKRAQTRRVVEERQTDTNDLSRIGTEKGFAKTVAKRTIPSVNSRREASESNTSSIQLSLSSDGDSRDQNGSVLRKSAPSTQKNGTERYSVVNDPAGNQRFICKVCHVVIKEERHMIKHLERPHIHDNLVECQECGNKYRNSKALMEHQQESHGQGAGSEGRTGQFQDWEVKKLNRYRDNFCEEFDITLQEFNEMMTATHDRQNWSYHGISRHEFLERYFAVLPHRNKRSMQRYRTLHFQNIPSKQEWTEDDDNDLEHLFQKLGPQWKEIGRRLTRDADAVRQRWKNRLKYRDTRVDGGWTRQEHEMLKDTVAQVQKMGRPDEGLKISWTAVSNKMGNIRTAQQCANHWADMHRKPKSTGRRSTVMSVKESRTTISDKYVRDSDTSGNESGVVETITSAARDRRSLHTAKTPESRRPIPKAPARLLKDRHAPIQTNQPMTDTPKETMSLSQAFQETQANISPLCGSIRPEKGRLTPIPDRPSPDIRVRHRPLSRETEEKGAELDGLSRLKIEQDQEDDTLTSAGAKHAQRERSRDFMTPSSTSSETTSSSGRSESDSSSHTDQRMNETKTNPRVIHPIPTPASQTQAQRTLKSRPSDLASLSSESTSSSGTTSATGDSSSSTSSDSESEQMKQESELDSGSDDEDDEMVADTKEDFMANILALSQARRRAVKAKMEDVQESTSSSGTDSDSGSDR